MVLPHAVHFHLGIMLCPKVFSGPIPVESLFLLPVRICKTVRLEVFSFKSLNFLEVFLSLVWSILHKTQQSHSGSLVEVKISAEMSIEFHSVKIDGQVRKRETTVQKSNFVSHQPVVGLSSMVQELGSFAIPFDVIVAG